MNKYFRQPQGQYNTLERIAYNQSLQQNEPTLGDKALATAASALNAGLAYKRGRDVLKAKREEAAADRAMKQQQIDLEARRVAVQERPEPVKPEKSPTGKTYQVHDTTGFHIIEHIPGQQPKVTTVPGIGPKLISQTQDYSLALRAEQIAVDEAESRYKAQHKAWERASYVKDAKGEYVFKPTTPEPNLDAFYSADPRIKSLRKRVKPDIQEGSEPPPPPGATVISK